MKPLTWPERISQSELLHMVIRKNGGHELVKALLDAGVESNLPEDPPHIPNMLRNFPGGNTQPMRHRHYSKPARAAIAEACKMEDVASVRTLLERKAGLLVRGTREAERTGDAADPSECAYFALHAGNLALMKLLVAHGVVVEQNRILDPSGADMPLWPLRMENEGDRMARARRAERSSERQYQTHPLEVAVESGNFPLVMWLLGEAGIDAASDEGLHALSVAVKEGHRALVAALLKKGVRVSQGKRKEDARHAWLGDVVLWRRGAVAT